MSIRRFIFADDFNPTQLYSTPVELSLIPFVHSFVRYNFINLMWWDVMWCDVMWEQISSGLFWQLLELSRLGSDQFVGLGSISVRWGWVELWVVSCVANRATNQLDRPLSDLLCSCRGREFRKLHFSRRKGVRTHEIALKEQGLMYSRLSIGADWNWPKPRPASSGSPTLANCDSKLANSFESSRVNRLSGTKSASWLDCCCCCWSCRLPSWSALSSCQLDPVNWFCCCWLFGPRKLALITIRRSARSSVLSLCACAIKSY